MAHLVDEVIALTTPPHPSNADRAAAAAAERLGGRFGRVRAAWHEAKAANPGTRDPTAEIDFSEEVTAMLVALARAAAEGAQDVKRRRAALMDLYESLVLPLPAPARLALARQVADDRWDVIVLDSGEPVDLRIPPDYCVTADELARLIAARTGA
jgi:hypothetical protein